MENKEIMKAVLFYANENGIEFRKYATLEEAQKAMEEEAAEARKELEANNYNDDSFQGWQVVDFTEDIEQAVNQAMNREVK